MTKNNDKEEFTDTFKDFVSKKDAPEKNEKVRKRKTPLKWDADKPKAAAKKRGVKSGTRQDGKPKESSQKSVETEEENPIKFEAEEDGVEPEEMEVATGARPSRRASLKAKKSLKVALEEPPEDQEEDLEASEAEIEDMSHSEADSEWDGEEPEEVKPKRGTKRKAPCTPVTKAKQPRAKSKPSTGRTRRKAPTSSEEDNEEEDEENEEEASGSEEEAADAEGNKDSDDEKKPSSLQDPVAETPFERDLVMKDSFFECGEFFVTRTDFRLCEYPPVWKMDAKSLIQKYEFVKVEDGTPTYRSVSTYAGYNYKMRRLYFPAKTKHISRRKNEHFISFSKNSVDFSSFSEPLCESMKSTESLKESFEVYLQALVTYCLESSFFDEIIKENDRYFLDAIDAVEGESKKRLEKLKPGFYWPPKITTLLEKYPLLNCQIVPMVASQKCQACADRAVTRRIELRGGEYDSFVLKVDENGQSNAPQSVCVQCVDVLHIYHRLTHNRLITFRVCNSAVQKLKNDEKTDPEILESLLNNADWVSKQFRDIQLYWAEADILIASLEKFSTEKEAAGQENPGNDANNENVADQ